MINSSYDSTTGLLTLRVTADLLSTNSEAAAAAFAKSLGSFPTHKALAIDLTACHMVDSVGLSLLFSVLSRSIERSVAAKVVIARGKLERILKVSQMGKLFKVEIV